MRNVEVAAQGLSDGVTGAGMAVNQLEASYVGSHCHLFAGLDILAVSNRAGQELNDVADDLLTNQFHVRSGQSADHGLAGVCQSVQASGSR